MAMGDLDVYSTEGLDKLTIEVSMGDFRDGLQGVETVKKTNNYEL